MQSATQQTFEEYLNMKQRFRSVFHQLEDNQTEDMSLAQFKLLTILKRTTIILNDYELNVSFQKKIQQLLRETRELMYIHNFDSLGSQDVQTEVCATLQKSMKF